LIDDVAILVAELGQTDIAQGAVNTFTAAKPNKHHFDLL